jgi:hypothetical protein
VEAFNWPGEERLSELADYRKIHRHCNVPTRYTENAKLGTWVATQRSQYNLHQEGKRSSMTSSRIQVLESLGFEWKPSIGWGKGHQRHQASMMTLDAFTRRRLAETSSADELAAEKAGEHWGEGKDDCVFDVLATISKWTSRVYYQKLDGN